MKQPWWSRVLCFFNCHDWRRGAHCVDCGAHDWLACLCLTCQKKRHERNIL